MRVFRELMEAQWALGKFGCVGLDTDFEKIPEVSQYHAVGDHYTKIYESVYRYNCGIIDATCDIIGFYKPNIAFYEGYGPPGLQALLDTMLYSRRVAPQIPVILDAKRADIGSTNEGYARAAFSIYGADAITVNPYFGREALEPFLRHADKGIFVLCRTSNPGAGEFQDVWWEAGRLNPISQRTGKLAFTLFEQVAHAVVTGWNTQNNCGLVVGATYPAELGHVRAIAPQLPILIPAIGAQGGDLEKTVAAGKDSRNQGMIINSSRGIIFAKRQENETFADAARRETLALHTNITNCLS